MSQTIIHCFFVHVQFPTKHLKVKEVLHYSFLNCLRENSSTLRDSNEEVLQQHVRDQHNGKDDSVMFNGESQKGEWVEFANGCLREITRLYPQGLIDLSNATLNPQHYRFTKFNASGIE